MTHDPQPAPPATTGELPIAASTPIPPMAAAPATPSGESVSPADTTATPATDDAPVAVTEVQMIDALKQVIDPELMVNVVDLGLVYSIEQADSKVAVEMTLTSPACPAGPQIIQQSKMALERLNGVREVEIRLVMSPPWTPERMTDEARDQLGIF